MSCTILTAKAHVVGVTERGPCLYAENYLKLQTTQKKREFNLEGQVAPEKSQESQPNPTDSNKNPQETASVHLGKSMTRKVNLMQFNRRSDP